MRRHPVLEHGIDTRRAAAYEAAVSRVMAMGEAEMLAFMPDKPITAFCECPKCYGGVEGNHIFSWTIERPAQMTCKFCGTVFPDAEYLEDQVLTGKNDLEEEVSFRYHLEAKRGVKHFLTGNLRRWQRKWIVAQCVALGKAYQATDNEDYARRVVLVLDKIARVYPHYPVMQNGVRGFRFRDSQQPPYAWDSGKWGFFHNEVPKGLVRAYDLVYGSSAFADLSRERGYDVRRKLEDDFLRRTYRVVEVSPYHVSNVVGYDIAGVALLGRVIGEPGYVHRAFGWMKRNLDEGFFRDGMWHEAPSYHYMTIGGLRSAFATVRGYSDPPGYLDPIDGTRFDDLDPEVRLPFWGRCLKTPETIGFPNGHSTPVHDTWAGERRAPPRETTVSTITPAYGHASLGRGRGEDQMQAQLHFSGGYGHAHLDSLNLTLYAKGAELLPDLGYTWTQMRYWCTSTLGHNTVVVDRRDQVASGSDGNLLWFFPDSGGVSVVEAEGRRAYRAVAGMERYRRLLVLVPVSPADAYVVDVFRVKGGKIHDWALHGSADEDSTATCSLPLGAPRKWLLEEGEAWQEPAITGARFNPYGMVRDVRGARIDESFRVEFRSTGDSARNLRLHMLGAGEGEVFLGRAPSVRRMGKGTSGDMRKAYDYWMPQLVVRRRGESPLRSTFAAVEEPFSATPFIQRVERVSLTPADPDALGLRIFHGVWVDTLISTLDDPPYTERRTADGITLRGRLGMVRRRGLEGEVVGAWLFEGKRLSAGRQRVESSAGRLAGEIEGAMRKCDGAEVDAFLTQAELPVGRTLHGVWLVATHGGEYTQGYEIDRVEREGGGTRIVLARDHGLVMTGGKVKEAYFPQREFSRPSTFVIPLAATLTVDRE